MKRKNLKVSRKNLKKSFGVFKEILYTNARGLQKNFLSWDNICGKIRNAVISKK